MGVLDEAIREHLELKRRHGADPGEVAHLERRALGPVDEPLGWDHASELGDEPESDATGHDQLSEHAAAGERDVRLFSDDPANHLLADEADAVEADAIEADAVEADAIEGDSHPIEVDPPAAGGPSHVQEETVEIEMSELLGSVDGDEDQTPDSPQPDSRDRKARRLVGRFPSRR